jgi:hypothetical protein
MPLALARFLAIVLTALALAPGLARVLELPHKIILDRQDHLVVQGIYRGWSLLGIVLFGALAANALVFLLSRGRRAAAGWALVATLLLIASLTIFFVWTYPVNQITANWTVAPPDWQALRARWEYSHAANALVTFFALCAAVAAGLMTRERLFAH